MKNIQRWTSRSSWWCLVQAGPFPSGSSSDWDTLAVLFCKIVGDPLWWAGERSEKLPVCLSVCMCYKPVSSFSWWMMDEDSTSLPQSNGCLRLTKAPLSPERGVLEEKPAQKRCTFPVGCLRPVPRCRFGKVLKRMETANKKGLDYLFLQCVFQPLRDSLSVR